MRAVWIIGYLLAFWPATESYKASLDTCKLQTSIFYSWKKCPGGLPKTIWQISHLHWYSERSLSSPQTNSRKTSVMISGADLSTSLNFGIPPVSHLSSNRAVTPRIPTLPVNARHSLIALCWSVVWFRQGTCNNEMQCNLAGLRVRIKAPHGKSRAATHHDNHSQTSSWRCIFSPQPNSELWQLCSIWSTPPMHPMPGGVSCPVTPESVVGFF